MKPFIHFVDVGRTYKSVSPVEIRMPGNRVPLPSDDLLRVESTQRGEFGFIDVGHQDYAKYVANLKVWIDSNLADRALLVLPEFAGSEEIERYILEQQRHVNIRCVVIGGSYYRMSLLDQSVESCCPIILPGGKVHYQLKFEPSPKEAQYGCSAIARGDLHVLRNTGYGDLAVLICSDAMPGRIGTILSSLRGEIDMLVVIARNHDKGLVPALRDLSRNEGWVIVYCNGITKDSCILTPLHGTRKMPSSLNGATVNIRELHRGFTRNPNMVAEPDRPGFHYRPRHYPVTVRSPLEFHQYLKVLAVGSHFDDIWLGCAATLMLLREVYGSQIVCTSLCSQYPYPYFGVYDLYDKYDELHAFLKGICHNLDFKWHNLLPQDDPLPDRGFNANHESLKNRVAKLSSEFSDVDLVFIPRRDDAHEDHVLTANAVFTEFRRATVLEYEVKDFRRRAFEPSILVDVSHQSVKDLTVSGQKIFAAGKSFAEKKAAILKEAFPIFLKGELPAIFDREHVLGRMTVRATETANTRYAEAFAADIVV